jgi:hypothetical protein
LVCEPHQLHVIPGRCSNDSTTGMQGIGCVTSHHSCRGVPYRGDGLGEIEIGFGFTSQLYLYIYGAFRSPTYDIHICMLCCSITLVDEVSKLSLSSSDASHCHESVSPLRPFYSLINHPSITQPPTASICSSQSRYHPPHANAN